MTTKRPTPKLPVTAPKRRQLEDYSKEELLAMVAKLRKQKKFGLVWEEKTEDVVEQCDRELPVLEELADRAVLTDPSLPTSILIEGDNFHALSVLNYTHAGKVDVIYIDPPYNTGNQTWKYNNKIIDREDPWKHTKWVSMMNKRLLLAKNLLKPGGALIVAIDDYEVHHLGLLLEEIFPNYERDLVIVEHHPQGAGSDTISRTHEYAFICTPPGVGFKGRQTKETEDLWSLKRSGQGENNWRKNRPNQFFAVLVNQKKQKVVGVGPEIFRDQKKYPLGKTSEGYVRLYPIDKNGKERVWRYNRTTMQKLITKGAIEYSAKGALGVRKEVVGKVPVFSVWKDSRYNAGTHGSALLTTLMGEANTFQYPKSLWTVYDMVRLVHSDKNAVILDFFAGSGTTAHAVLKMNEEDGGNRRFILVTNNENKIAEDVTYPRVRKVIGGSSKEEPLPANLRYFRTEFVPRNDVSDDTRRALVRRATDMIRVREGAFTKKADNRDFKIYTDGSKTACILFDLDSVEEFKKKIADAQLPASIYVFSLTNDSYAEEFEDLDVPHKLCPIPESILEVYKRIFD